MFEEMTFQRLSVGSIYKLIAIGMSVSLVPFCILMGIFASFGANTLTWNGGNIHGLSALIASPFIGLVIALIFTLFFGSMVTVGLCAFSKFRPVTLRIKSQQR